MCFNKDKQNNEAKKYGYPMGPQGSPGIDQMFQNSHIKPEEKEPEFEVLPQVDPRLNKDIQSYGCRFMSLLAIPQYHLKKSLTAEQINNIYSECILDPDIVLTNHQYTCKCGTKEHVIINKGFAALGSNSTGSQVYPWKVQEPEDIPKGIDFTIIQWSTIVSGSVASHFELGTPEGRELYDPGAKTFDKFIRRFFEIDENANVDVSTDNFKPTSWLIYKVYDKA